MKKIIFLLSLLASFLFLIGCDQSVQSDRPSRKGISHRSYGDTELVSYEFEDHKFIIARSTGISIIHHPGCPCLK